MAHQSITWPLTGGLSTKNNPLTLAPGSHLALDNVRQERRDEWRPRYGYTQSALDTLPGGNPVVRQAILPAGGSVGMTAETGNAPAGRSYSPNVTGTAKWIAMTTPFDNGSSGCAQSTPCVWQRTPLTSNAQETTSPIDQISFAVGGGFQAIAWRTRFGKGRARVLSDADGVSVSPDTSASVDRIRAVYSASANKLLVFYVDAGTGNLVVDTWANGIQTVSHQTVMNGLHTTNPYLDAIEYGGSSTITVVARTSGDQIKVVEWNASTMTATSTVTLAITCDSCLVLLPDPDASGTRFIGVSDAGGPNTRVVRCNSATTVLTNDVAASLQSFQIAGCAYQAGAGWMIVSEHAAGLSAVKKRSGAISGVAAIETLTYHHLHSNAWREPGTDLMRYVVGLHAGSQNNFYELALEFENGAGSITNIFTEPQARMLPLNAGPVPISNAALPQVVRTGAGKFSTALSRLARLVVEAAGPGDPNSYAVDRWDETMISTANARSLNSGDGITSNQSAFIPAGNLLQSYNGSFLCAHGAMAEPLIVFGIPAPGAGLMTLRASYSYLITVEMLDEGGNIWRSPLSTPTVIVLAGGQNQVALTANLTPFENLARRRTVKFWRTLGDGTLFRLLHAVTDTIANTTIVTFTDQISDATLAGAEPISQEIPTSLTPAVSHVAIHGGRMWAADRDFPTTLWYTKPLSTGLAPEFCFSFIVDDASGPITGLASMDDKLVVTKAAAVCVVTGDGQDNTGGGFPPQVTKISSDVGNVVGAPLISTGDEVYFTAARGIHRMNRGLQITQVGAPIDRYLTQPTVQAPGTVSDAVFVPAYNEIRFQIGSAQFTFDRASQLWIRDTGNAFSGALMSRIIAGRVAIFHTDGTIWYESTTATADNGVGFAPTIRSAWVRPAGMEGRLRLYSARALGSRASVLSGITTTPTLTIYFDSDDTISESFSPTTPIPVNQPLVRAWGKPRKQKCSAFSLQLTLPSGDVTTRLEAWMAEIGGLPDVAGVPENRSWT